MSDEQGVALEGVETVGQEAPQVETQESAQGASPVSEATTEAEVSTELSTEPPKGAEKRIKKLITQKHQEREQKEKAQEEAARLRKEIEELKANKPKLEDFDHDEVKFQEALIQHTVDERVLQRDITQTEQVQEAPSIDPRESEVIESYQDSIEDFVQRSGMTLEAFKAKGDYVESALATLDSKTSHILIMGVAELGAEATNYLFDNPDQLVTLMEERSPVAQGKLLAELQAKVNLANTANRVSNAPEPAPDVGGSTGGIAQRMTAEEAAKQGQTAYSQYRRERDGGKSFTGMGRVITKR